MIGRLLYHMVDTSSDSVSARGFDRRGNTARPFIRQVEWLVLAVILKVGLVNTTDVLQGLSRAVSLLIR